MKVRSLCMVAGIAIIALGLCALAKAQAHSATIKWTNSPDTANTNVYRFSGNCPSPLTGFIKLTAAPVTAATYVDTTVVPGTYCYYLTAALNGAESVPSPTVTANVPVAPPTGVTITLVSININGSQQTVVAKWTDDSNTQQDFFFSDGTKVLNRGLTSSLTGTFAQQVKTAIGVPVRFTVCTAQGNCVSQLAM